MTRPAAGDLAARIACVDDDTLIREGAARLLRGVDVVATYARVEDLLAQAPTVDVVLLDLWIEDPANISTGALTEFESDVFVGGPASPPVLFGAKAVAAVAAAGYRVLIYTNERRRLVLAQCLAHGASGIVHKSEPLERVVEAIDVVHGGGMVITTALSGLAELVERHGALPTLSPRQLEVLRGRARGETYRAIASRLFISPKTAEEYMGEVTRRFSDFLRQHSPADLERMLGVGPGDLLER